MIGWIIAAGIASALFTSAIIAFWDDIKQWLNSVAANFVEEHFGYKAREKMEFAVSKVSRVVDVIRNKSVIYTKNNRLDEYYDKTTIVAEQDVYEIDKDVIAEIDKKGELVQEFVYSK